jgi:hypothetical protein
LEKDVGGRGEGRRKKKKRKKNKTPTLLDKEVVDRGQRNRKKIEI